MRLQALLHLVTAVQALSRCERLRVFGSSALLTSFPELGEAGGPLEVTFDADFFLEPCDQELAAVLNESVGEDSFFANHAGYHADILHSSILRTVPPGWEQRLIEFPGVTGDVAAVSPEDLAVVKLRAGRDKDLMICRYLLAHGLLSFATLRHRLDQTPMPEAEIVRVYRRFKEVADNATPSAGPLE